MSTSPTVVRSLDNVPIELPLAGVATRGLAFALDSVILSLLSAVMAVAALSVSALAEKGQGWIWGVLLLGLFLVQSGYFWAAEVLMHGRTPGKAVFKLRVITAEGGEPSAGALLMRNLVRFMPDIFVGVFLMAADPLARRAGDRLAGTLVIREVEERSPVVLTRVPPGWGGAEVAVVEAYLERAEGLESEVSWEIGGRIVRWLQRDHPDWLEGIELENRHPATVLHEVFGVESFG